MLLQVCKVGNGGATANTPPCTAPDTILGAGSVDLTGQFNVTVMPPLDQGDCVYPFDTCVQRVGAVVCVSAQTVAPALSWRLLAIVIALLVSAGFLRVRLSESGRNR